MKVQAWKWKKVQKFAYRLGQVLGVLFSMAFLATFTFIIGYMIMNTIVFAIRLFIFV